MLLTAFSLVASGTLAAPLVDNRTSTRAEWELLPGFQTTVATGISFSSPTEGIVIGGENGIGASVWATNDGGATLPRAFMDSESPPLMLLSGAAIREESVASGVFAAWASQDGGAVYRPAGGPGSVGPSQSVDAFFQEGVPYFVITGDTLTHNGVAVSRDGGLTFEAGIDVFDDKTIEANIGARYGAFPSSNAWYVSGGRWPSNDADADPGLHSLSENVAVTKPRNGSDATWRPLPLKFTHPTSQRRRRAQDPSDPFTAGVSKSTDSGATWHTVYESDTSGYYFNQITCWDDDRCAVVAEGGGAARILVTSDGGLTWRQTLDATGSLMAIEALSAGGSSPGEGWAGGGVLGIIQFTGHYWHTLDFGETWALTELTGAYCFDLSFAPGQNEVGFSTVLTPSVSRLARYGA